MKAEQFSLTPKYNSISVRTTIIMFGLVLLVNLAIAVQQNDYRVLFYGIFFAAIYFGTLLNTNRKNRLAEVNEGFQITLTDTSLKITQSDSLLWSKERSSISSIELEEKNTFGIKSQAILIKSDDHDSYYLNVPQQLASGQNAESIVTAINAALKNPSQNIES